MDFSKFDEVIGLLEDNKEKIQENDFMKIQSDKVAYPVYVKVDGNRQIRVYQISDSDVFAKIEDLNAKYSNP